jgi:hypothetical protein
MNRIRETSRGFEVLITPSMDFLIGRWMDVYPHKFMVEIYNNYDEAQDRAMDLPDINWTRLVEIHEHEYERIANEIKNILKSHRFMVEYHPSLKSPESLKNKFFEAVLNAQENGEEFSMMKKINDVINIIIVNPWTENLREISKVLTSQYSLKIYNTFEIKNKIIHLQGRTIMDTPYEIQLWTSMLYNWKQWHEVYGTNQKLSLNKFNKCLLLQDSIDKNMFKIR